jgi:hypothetical protein
MNKYFKQSNGFRYVKIINDSIENAELIEVNLYDFNTSIEFRKMLAHLTDCLPCTAEEFSEAVAKAKQFIGQHLTTQP